MKLPAFGTAVEEEITRRSAAPRRRTCFLPRIFPLYANGRCQEEVTRDFEKTFTLSGNQGLSLDHRLGQVHIHGVSGHELKISAKIHVQSPQRTPTPRTSRRKSRSKFAKSNDGVHVRTIYPDTKFPIIRIGGRTSYSVDYDIAMPADAPLWLHNDFGNADVTGVHGWSQLENGHGVLTVRDAGSAKLVNSFGRIELSNASGNCSDHQQQWCASASPMSRARWKFAIASAKLKFRRSAAQPLFPAAMARSLFPDAGGNSTISNSFGEVTVRNVNGSLSVSNSNGKIDATDVTGNAELKNQLRRSRSRHASAVR